MPANALTLQQKTTTRRRNARRSSVFGNALGNAAVTAYADAAERRSVGKAQAEVKKLGTYEQTIYDMLREKGMGHEDALASALSAAETTQNEMRNPTHLLASNTGTMRIGPPPIMSTDDPYPSWIETGSRFSLAQAVTAGDLVRGFGTNADTAATWAPLLSEAMEKYEINTAQRRAAFLAQASVETGNFENTVTEGFGYQRGPALDKFPALRAHPEKAALFWDGTNKWVKPADREAFANLIYGVENKNMGSLFPGDGYLFRGRGIFQLTGRYNYTQIGRLIGQPLDTNPSLVSEPRIGSMAAGAYFKSHGLNKLADAGTEVAFKQLTHAINKNNENGALRWSRYKAILPVLSPVKH